MRGSRLDLVDRSRMRAAKCFAWLIFLLLCVHGARADDSFVVEDIRIDGLQRISAGTVFNYLPIQVGDTFNQMRSAEAIRALFKTGFFKDVRMERDGDVLIIHVVERPAIAKITLEGNKDIKTEDLLKVLNENGVEEGKVFNRQVLDRMEQGLRQQYFSRGKYGVKIDSTITPLSRNRVSVLINISEGTVARIQQINIVGNESFAEDDLLDLFELSTSNLLSFYTKDDQYSKQKLSADLERLRSYYLDRGYINFTIESTQISITPDKKEIYITVNLTEGPVFTLEEVRLAGDLVVAPDDLIPLVLLGPGEIFSRKSATETSKAITERLGNEGYAFANVNMVPDIDEDAQTVKLTFFVDPGKRVYVRRINIKGNTKTRDEVIRREIRQMESSWAATSKVEHSKTRLERLGYFEAVNVETPAVPGSPDQLDVEYTVEEKSAGNLSAGVGFSQVQGLIFNASVTQENVLGTGKRINFNFNNSNVSTIYQIGYLNPYFTLDGISLGYDVSYVATDGNAANVSRYALDEFRLGINSGIPLNEFDRLRMNLDFKRTKVRTFANTPCEIKTTLPTGEDNPLCTVRRFPPGFVNVHGDTFNVVPLSVGWSHDSRNRAVFATDGGIQTLSALATLPGLDLEYYKINYRVKYFFPLASDFTLSLSGDVAYGDGYGDTDDLPFFENYFAGGVQSVRGFRDNTLGPRDSNNDPFGGNAKLIASAELYFPVPFLSDYQSIRLGGFFDAGNVFANQINLGELRYSAGLSAEWLSPFGALKVSVAQPFNRGDNDNIQRFQFSFGSGF